MCLGDLIKVYVCIKIYLLIFKSVLVAIEKELLICMLLLIWKSLFFSIFDIFTSMVLLFPISFYYLCTYFGDLLNISFYCINWYGI